MLEITPLLYDFLKENYPDYILMFHFVRIEKDNVSFSLISLNKKKIGKENIFKNRNFLANQVKVELQQEFDRILGEHVPISI